MSQELKEQSAVGLLLLVTPERGSLSAQAMYVVVAVVGKVVNSQAAV